MARINDEMGITQEQIKQLMDNYIFMIETEKQQNSEIGMISLVKRDLFGKQIFAVGLLNKGTFIDVDTEDVIDEEAFEKIVEKIPLVMQQEYIQTTPLALPEEPKCIGMILMFIDINGKFVHQGYNTKCEEVDWIELFTESCQFQKQGYLKDRFIQDQKEKRYYSGQININYDVDSAPLGLHGLSCKLNVSNMAVFIKMLSMLISDICDKTGMPECILMGRVYTELKAIDVGIKSKGKLKVSEIFKVTDSLFAKLMKEANDAIQH